MVGVEECWDGGMVGQGAATQDNEIFPSMLIFDISFVFFYNR